LRRGIRSAVRANPIAANELGAMLGSIVASAPREQLASVVAAALLGLISWWLQLAFNLGRKRRKFSKTWDYRGDGRHEGWQARMEAEFVSAP